MLKCKLRLNPALHFTNWVRCRGKNVFFLKNFFSGKNKLSYVLELQKQIANALQVKTLPAEKCP